MGLRNAVDAAHVAALNIGERIKGGAHRLLVAGCVLVAYRRGNDVPWVSDRAGEFREATAAESAESAVEHGRALASAIIREACS
jgi:hypothetical protein